MESGKDPRTTETGGHKNPAPPPSGTPSPAPGGVGTGTKSDPADKQPERPVEKR